MSVCLSVPLEVHDMCACLNRPQEGMESLGTDITDLCELSYGLKLKLGPRKE